MEFPTSSRHRQPPQTITCVDCGGTAHLLTTFAPDDPPRGGDLLAYRCADCNDRWDLMIEEDDLV